jgi:hypothetical protein
MATDLEARGFAHGVAGAARHLVRLTRAGAFSAETSDAKFPPVTQSRRRLDPRHILEASSAFEGAA